MSGKKGLGETVLGWFVVREDDEVSSATPDELIEKYEKNAKTPPQAPPVKLAGDVPTVRAGSSPDRGTFAKVYRSADISDEEQERVEKAIKLLQSLPADTPKDVRKQIVEASLQAFGIPLDQIIEAGASEIQALEAFIQHGEQHTQSILVDAKARIDKLAADITELKRLMEMQVESQRTLVKSCNDEKLRVQVVLEFFGQEAVARVVRDSPKLVEPKG